MSDTSSLHLVTSRQADEMKAHGFGKHGEDREKEEEEDDYINISAQDTMKINRENRIYTKNIERVMISEQMKQIQ